MEMNAHHVHHELYDQAKGVQSPTLLSTLEVSPKEELGFFWGALGCCLEKVAVHWHVLWVGDLAVSMCFTCGL